MVTPFYTIGHGTRPLRDFVELLRSVAVTLVVDVRTVPIRNITVTRCPNRLSRSKSAMSTSRRSGDCAAARAKCRPSSTRSGTTTVFARVP